MRARGFLTRLPNRPCTANLGLPVLEGTGILCLGSCWPHCTVLNPQATRHWSLVFVVDFTGRCRSLLVAGAMQRSLFNADPLGLGSLLTAGLTNPLDAPQLHLPVLRQPWTPAATLPTRFALSNLPQSKLPTLRNPSANPAQIARTRFPRQVHSILESALPWTRIYHVWSLATGRCLLAVPFSEARELSRSWRCSAQAPKPLVGAVVEA